MVRRKWIEADTSIRGDTWFVLTSHEEGIDYGEFVARDDTMFYRSFQCRQNWRTFHTRSRAIVILRGIPDRAEGEIPGELWGSLQNLQIIVEEPRRPRAKGQELP